MMSILSVFSASFLYISQAPYFWLSIGLSIGFAMFVGAVIYDGELSQAWKGAITFVLYAFFLSQMSFTRVYSVRSNIAPENSAQAFAGVTTIILLSVIWIVGILIGVAISKRFHKHKIIY